MDKTAQELTSSTTLRRRGDNLSLQRTLLSCFFLAIHPRLVGKNIKSHEKRNNYFLRNVFHICILAVVCIFPVL